ncbi:MAG: hypothetical protein M1835_000626 [Candelina submexicana]|nr:MAG: hypothetical protein M1835_000626 [Candelina submexicana]
MPLNFSAAHSSRITKPKSKVPSLRRATSSPFADHPRRKPIERSKTKPEEVPNDGLLQERLPDTGLVPALGSDRRGVIETVRHILESMFDEVPERGGMNSVRIAEVLNFRKSLPSIVQAVHVHALTGSPTTTEREIAKLVTAGSLRKLVVPGRSAGGSAVGDGLVLVDDWKQAVRGEPGLSEAVKENFVQILNRHPTAISLPHSELATADAAELMHAGFLTSSTPSWRSTDLFSRPGEASLGTLGSISTIGSKAASGTVDAVGGEDAFHGAGGGSGLRNYKIRAKEGERALSRGEEYLLSLPSTGPYLRLVTSARTHLMTLLSKSRYREAPVNLLRERWNGGIAGDDQASRRRKARGEFAGVLPGRTRKWKQFYGLRFDWVLEECLGAGLIEIFETGSVGRGVRAT